MTIIHQDMFQTLTVKSFVPTSVQVHANKLDFSVNLSVTESCLPNPCLNDGECINEDGKPVCKCKGRFSGQFCESKIFACLKPVKSNARLVIG